MKPLLFALQFWDQDAAAAHSLLELIADIVAPNKYEGVDLLISVKNETPLDIQWVAKVGRAFDRVYTFRCAAGPKGWPAGPNHQAEQTWRYFVQQVRSGRWKHSGLFLAEPDGIPCSRDWMERIKIEWDACGRPAMGCMCPSGPSGAADHVNGNLIMSIALNDLRADFARAPRDLAWDWFYRKFLIDNSHPARTIFSDYKTPDVDPEILTRPRTFTKHHPLFGQPEFRPAWLHGPKNWQEVHPAMRKFLQLSSEKPIDSPPS